MFSKNVKLIQYLLINEKENTVKSKDICGKNILHLASCNNSNIEIIKFLSHQFKNDKAFLESKDDCERNILHFACRNNSNIEIVQFLYDQFKNDKVFLQSKDNCGRTALSLLSVSKKNFLNL